MLIKIDMDLFSLIWKRKHARLKKVVSGLRQLQKITVLIARNKKVYHVVLGEVL